MNRTMDAVLSTRVALPWSKDLAWIKKELTIVSTPTSALDTPAKLEMYEIKDSFIHVPKAWAIENAAKLGITSFKDEQHAGTGLQPEETELTLPLGLRPHQVLAVDAIVKAFHDNALGGGALLCLSCGMGKSVSALEVIHRMGLKTLIIVNTAVLASQWRNVIAQYVPGARVGLIQQAKFEVENKTHVVAVAHTVAGNRYDFSEAGFGLCITDEIHRVCCPTLSKCISKAGTRYRLGLTATPVRPDGFNTFLQYAIGDIAFQLQRDNPEDLRVYSIHLDAGPCRMHTIKAKGKQTPCIAKILNDMQGTEPRAQERQAVAAKWIRRCADKGRQILVVADRISLLEELAEMVNDDLAVAFLIGKTKAKDRETAKDARVIFASYPIAAEGLDIPTLDSLLMLTPRSGSNVIVQSVGRLLRSGGRSPLVIDLVDNLSVYQNMYRKRCVEYRSLGAIITKWSEHDEKL
jgi:superfamily II DNA or RNA helicase